jgi:hypothetical protein
MVKKTPAEKFELIGAIKATEPRGREQILARLREISKKSLLRPLEEGEFAEMQVLRRRLERLA